MAWKTTHGMARTPEYQTWVNMKQRCTNPKTLKYKYYGGRGIKVCRGWSDSFMCFFEDVGPRVSSKHSIDRIDNNGNYCCGKCSECIENGWRMNCRWATKLTQCFNKETHQKTKSGHVGVRNNHGKWQAYATVQGVFHHYGSYTSVEEAVAARKEGLSKDLLSLD